MMKTHMHPRKHNLLTILLDTLVPHSLSKSCALALSQFYEAFPRVPVAVVGGAAKIRGFDVLLSEVEKLTEEYFDVYLGWIQQERERMLEKKKVDAEKEYSKFEDELEREDDE